MKRGERLQKAAESHPDFKKWEALLSEAVPETSENDAMEHLAENREDLALELAHAMSELYWAQRMTGEDASGFNDTGEHDKKPQEFADQCGISLVQAREIFEDAGEKVKYTSKKLKRAVERLGPDTYFPVKQQMDDEIRLLREQVSELQVKLREAA